MNRIYTIVSRTLWFGIVAIAILFLAGPSAFAGGKDCDHPRFLEKGCGYEGGNGEDGADGKDGRDGIDGADGKDGRDGIDGIDGKDGADGIVDYNKVNKVIDESFHTWRNYAAAMQAIQIHLPQDSSQRFTLSGSSVGGTTGIGAGYAYKFDRDDNLAVTAGVGSAGGEQVGVVSIGFEFGARTPVAYNDSGLERRLETLEKNFQRQQELWNEDAKRCAAELDNEKRRSGNIERKFMSCLQK